MKILDIALKDMLRSFRSLFAVGMMFGAPLLITGLIYFAFSGVNTGGAAVDMPPLKVAVVNMDRPAQGQPDLGNLIISFLQDERMPAWLQVTTLQSEAEARTAIENQQIGVAVLIPDDFSKQAISSGGYTTLTVLQDPTLTIGPEVIKNLLGQFSDGVSGSRIAIDVINQQVSARGIALDKNQSMALAQQFSDWFTTLQQNLNHSSQPALAFQTPAASSEAGTITANPMSRLIGLIMAGQLIFFAFYTGAYTTTSLLRETEEGTLLRLFTTPTPRSTILAGKFLSVFAMVIVQSLVLIVVSTFAFKIQWGNPLAIALVVLAQVVAASGFGILLVSFMKNTRQSGAVLGGVLTIFGMLGGLFTVVVSNMPPAFDTISLFTPQGWALSAWRLVLDGAAPAELVLNMAVLLAAGALFFAAGAQIFRNKFA